MRQRQRNKGGTRWRIHSRANREYQERLEVRVKAQAERLETLFLASIQSLADALELKVSDELWPLPKYREMLFPV